MILSRLFIPITAVFLLSGCVTGTAKNIVGSLANGIDPRVALNPISLGTELISGAIDYNTQQRNKADFKKFMSNPNYINDTVIHEFNKNNGTNFKSLEELTTFIAEMNKKQLNR